MKKILVPLLVLSCMLVYPISIAETIGDSGSELETYIHTGFNVGVFQIIVENIGDGTAHNVTITNASTEGNILFNFQESRMWSDDVEPGGRTTLDTNGMAFGLGVCHVSITVSCDEGITSTSSAVGLCIGPLIIIP